ncbi:uncharacterized protein A4U43_C05F20550 [Asparagus officinalis]|uniref:Uncharacterized protein n=1 Tax=Asparagus officinalis TaxID=4686 RepID=A0A5P1ETC1_ASPOF|nr:uncharacterized protein A4U43_C05F20550 [Asparagus officinalis]
MAELSDNTKQIQLPSYPLPLPNQESPIRSPTCPTCGSTIPNRPQRLIAAAGISEHCDNGHKDSEVFSRVLLTAVSRMCTITREAIEQEKMLMESKDAMIGILENVCLMKSTIKYLLNETFNGRVNNDVENKENIAVKMKEEENEEEEDDDRGSNASFIVREDASEEEEDNENDAYDEEEQGDRVNEGGRISRKDDGGYNNNHEDHPNGSDHDGNNDDDDGECRSLLETGVEKEVLTSMISQGVIGGIATMSLIAKDAPKANNLLLADDKEALLVMLDIVRMMKLLIE